MKLASSIASLRSFLARGEAAKRVLSVRLAAKRLNVPKSTLHRHAKRLGGWYRNPRYLSPETKRQLDRLIAEEVPVREICDRLGIGDGSVTRRKQWLRDQNGELPPGHWWRCPVCGGKIVLVRCPADQIDRPSHVPLRDSGAPR